MLASKFQVKTIRLFLEILGKHQLRERAIGKPAFGMTDILFWDYLVSWF
jgi:hypothetical protein